jgi:hypothetical protein
MSFSLEKFREQRLRKKRLGAWGFWTSTVLLVLDLTTPLPTVERGAFLFVWLALMGIFAGTYILGSRLPLEETIEVARLHNNQLLVTDVTRELNVTLATAERILAKLVEKGIAIRTNSPDDLGITVYIFPELKADKPIPITPTEWEAYQQAQERDKTTAKPQEAKNRKPDEGLMDKQ